ncbi:MAG: FAD-dependent oxidoreductase [Roseiflexaceae bacterium]
MSILTPEILIIGGGLGGVAAALAACQAGRQVLLCEPTDWLGGQMTSQGTSALDEHRYIEQFGATRSYAALRQAIRDHYRSSFGIDTMPDGRPLNPGNAWVSNLCFEPIVGVRAIATLLAPFQEQGLLDIRYGLEPIAASCHADQISEVRFGSADASDHRLHPLLVVQAQMVLDASELGDLLLLAGVEHVTGAESVDDTGEPFAVSGPARPREVQGFTYCFAVEYCPGEDHTIAKPEEYEQLRDRQPYTLTLAHRSGPPRPFRVFEQGPTGLPPFWSYRRLLDGALLDPSGTTRDIAMINWPGNDFHHGDLVGAGPAERAHLLDQARRLALGFLYWLQTECPRDDGSGFGYPELRLIPKVMGSDDGLSKAPYIRESRRIIARKRILAHEILDLGQPQARSTDYRDSVGVGWYHMDLHPANGNPIDRFEPTKPFQIPLGALIPIRVRNLLACCKNIGTTHLSNGAYRLHPVEWNIGESAGTLAAMCLDTGQSPAAIHANPQQIQQLQQRLLDRGVPLAWAIDLPEQHPLFAISQRLIVAGAIAADGSRSRSLELQPDAILDSADRQALLQAVQQLGLRFVQELPEQVSWAAAIRCIGNQ